MATNITDVQLDENHTFIVEFVHSVSSEAAFEAAEIEYQPHGVVVAREQTYGTAPDPVTTVRFVQFVPYANIRAIRQSWSV